MFGISLHSAEISLFSENCRQRPVRTRLHPSQPVRSPEGVSTSIEIRRHFCRLGRDQSVSAAGSSVLFGRFHDVLREGLWSRISDIQMLLLETRFESTETGSKLERTQAMQPYGLASARSLAFSLPKSDCAKVWMLFVSFARLPFTTTTPRR